MLVHNIFIGGTSTPKAPSGGDDGGRADLLAAIRKAGGAGKAKLKSAKDRKAEVKKAKEKEKSVGKYHSKFRKCTCIYANIKVML